MMVMNNTDETKTFRVGNKFYTFLKGQMREVSDQVIKEHPEIAEIMKGSEQSKVVTKSKKTKKEVE